MNETNTNPITPQKHTGPTDIETVLDLMRFHAKNICELTDTARRLLRDNRHGKDTEIEVLKSRLDAINAVLTGKAERTIAQNVQHTVVEPAPAKPRPAEANESEKLLPAPQVQTQPEKQVVQMAQPPCAEPTALKQRNHLRRIAALKLLEQKGFCNAVIQWSLQVCLLDYGDIHVENSNDYGVFCDSILASEESALRNEICSRASYLGIQIRKRCPSARVPISAFAYALYMAYKHKRQAYLTKYTDDHYWPVNVDDVSSIQGRYWSPTYIKNHVIRCQEMTSLFMRPYDKFSHTVLTNVLLKDIQSWAADCDTYVTVTDAQAEAFKLLAYHGANGGIWYPSGELPTNSALAAWSAQAILWKKHTVGIKRFDKDYAAIAENVLKALGKRYYFGFAYSKVYTPRQLHSKTYLSLDDALKSLNSATPSDWHTLFDFYAKIYPNTNSQSELAHTPSTCDDPPVTDGPESIA